MNRIEEKFKELKKGGRKGFIPFITWGDPNLTTSKDLVFSLEKAGADIIELGVPFSDPIADGPTIQASSQRALTNKIGLKKVIQCAKDIRKKSPIPLALLSYFNPIYKFGIKNFIKESKNVVDGVVIPDLPPEEAKLLKGSGDDELPLIFLLAPTSTEKRIKLVSQFSQGFIYVVSVSGVTGARKTIPYKIKNLILKIRNFTEKPICLGFGISTPEQVKVVKDWVDGVIVGSALVNIIEKYAKNKKLMMEEVEKFTKNLKEALSS
ncbi:MAG: tryptophan synthase subunit alpha [Candidatus Aerophobetes bacterium]|nr:tryptophan synthase subunit alpha [Candidatus Aerophobetes bacterium]